MRNSDQNAIRKDEIRVGVSKCVSHNYDAYKYMHMHTPAAIMPSPMLVSLNRSIDLSAR